MSDPWFRFFPSDWISGVSGLSAAERGVYVTLLAIMYDHGAPIGRDDARLSRQCGLPKAGFVRALDGLISTGKIIVEDGCLWNSRVKTELTERENRKLTASSNAKSRWQNNEGKQHNNDATASNLQCENDASRARLPQPQPHTDPIGSVVRASSPPKTKRASPRTEIAEDEQPVEADLEFARAAGMDSRQIREEWAQFRDHHRKLANRMADWRAAWRTWVRNSKRFQARAGPEIPLANDRRVYLDKETANREIDRRFDERIKLAREAQNGSSGKIEGSTGEGEAHSRVLEIISRTAARSSGGD